MIMGYYRLGLYDDARRSMKYLLSFARRFRMDNSLTNFGTEVYEPKRPINCWYDAWGVPAAMIRGLFEYLYRADGLTILPHVPSRITRLEQQFPIRFGRKRLYLATTGQGPVTGVTINGQAWKTFDARSVFLAYGQTPDEAVIEISLGGAKAAPRAPRKHGPPAIAPAPGLTICRNRPSRKPSPRSRCAWPPCAISTGGLSMPAWETPTRPPTPDWLPRIWPRLRRGCEWLPMAGCLVCRRRLKQPRTGPMLKPPPGSAREWKRSFSRTKNPTTRRNNGFGVFGVPDVSSSPMRKDVWRCEHPVRSPLPGYPRRQLPLWLRQRPRQRLPDGLLRRLGADTQLHDRPRDPPPPVQPQGRPADQRERPVELLKKEET